MSGLIGYQVFAARARKMLNSQHVSLSMAGHHQNSHSSENFMY
jgi:hypothetical protein